MVACEVCHACGAGGAAAPRRVMLAAVLCTLGGCAALQRVYEYCCREENGVQEDGEREAVLAFMGGRQELLPLVHTLLYLEETLEMRAGPNT